MISMVDARIAMVDHQIRPADVTNYQLLAAFLNTRREAFLPAAKSFQAYGEFEVEIAPGRCMMTPRSFAKLVEIGKVTGEDEVLLICGNLGYEAAILAQISANVVAVEPDRKLAGAAEKTLSEQGFDNAVVIPGNPLQGAKKSGPYDVVLFSGAIWEIPKAIPAQLKEGGRIVAMVHEGRASAASAPRAKLFHKKDGELGTQSYFQAAAPSLPGFEIVEEFSF